MTNLKDMPMISVEQKNRFREAALEVEKERDELAQKIESLREAFMTADTWEDVGDIFTGMKTPECLYRRDAITAANATRHAATLVRARDKITRSELAALLEEVASMQEAMDNGDSE